MAEAGTAELSRRGGPGSAAALAQLDVSDLPLIIEAARLTQDADDQSRYLFGLDALLYGFAVARTRPADGAPRLTGRS
jgi:hypothetical protein